MNLPAGWTGNNSLHHRDFPVTPGGPMLRITIRRYGLNGWDGYESWDWRIHVGHLTLGRCEKNEKTAAEARTGGITALRVALTSALALIPDTSPSQQET